MVLEGRILRRKEVILISLQSNWTRVAPFWPQFLSCQLSSKKIMTDIQNFAERIAQLKANCQENEIRAQKIEVREQAVQSRRANLEGRLQAIEKVIAEDGHILDQREVAIEAAESDLDRGEAELVKLEEIVTRPSNLGQRESALSAEEAQLKESADELAEIEEEISHLPSEENLLVPSAEDLDLWLWEEAKEEPAQPPTKAQIIEAQGATGTLRAMGIMGAEVVPFPEHPDVIRVRPVAPQPQQNQPQPQEPVQGQGWRVALSDLQRCLPGLRIAGVLVLIAFVISIWVPCDTPIGVPGISTRTQEYFRGSGGPQPHGH